MQKSVLALAAILGVVVAAPASAAQFTFNFTGTDLLHGTPLDGTGVFTTSDVATTVGGQTAFAITGVSGMFDGSAIVPTGPSYGNYFTTGPSFLDGTGVTFSTAAGNNVVFFYQDTVQKYRVNLFGVSGGTGFVTAGTSAIAAVPEPATWAMMLVGFGGLGAVLRRRRSRFVPAVASA